MRASRPVIEDSKFDLLNKGAEASSLEELLTYSELDDFFSDFPFLRESRKFSDQTNLAILYFAYSTLLIKNKTLMWVFEIKNQDQFNL